MKNKHIVSNGFYCYRKSGYRFYFFSREERRIHVHVSSSRGEAKFWIEPDISLAINYGLTKTDVNNIIKIMRNGKMKSSTTGKSTSKVEVLNISRNGIWLFVLGKEYFLPFNEYPWFKEAPVKSIVNVNILHGMHLYWPDLDVDLEVDSLDYPENYPLTYKRII